MAIDMSPITTDPEKWWVICNGCGKPMKNFGLWPVQHPQANLPNGGDFVIREPQANIQNAYVFACKTCRTPQSDTPKGTQVRVSILADSVVL